MLWFIGGNHIQIKIHNMYCDYDLWVCFNAHAMFNSLLLSCSPLVRRSLAADRWNVSSTRFQCKWHIAHEYYAKAIEMKSSSLARSRRPSLPLCRVHTSTHKHTHSHSIIIIIGLQSTSPVACTWSLSAAHLLFPFKWNANRINTDSAEQKYYHNLVP